MGAEKAKVPSSCRACSAIVSQLPDLERDMRFISLSLPPCVSQVTGEYLSEMGLVSH
jgi:hypothetical protein